jgi:hypothetical protein
MQLVGIAHEISGRTLSGVEFPPDYFPFALPLQVTLNYSAVAHLVKDPRKLGIVRFERERGYTSTKLYILKKDAQNSTISFCASCFGQYALVQMA